MFDHKQYVPILKWKRGELRALEDVENSVRQHVTPLFEMQPLNDKTTLESVFAELVPGISRAWKTNKPVFVDFSELEGSLSSSPNATQHLTQAYNDSMAESIGIIPVITSQTPQTLLSDYLASGLVSRYGIAVRFSYSDFKNATVNNLLASLVNHHAILSGRIDVLIDLKYVDPSMNSLSLDALRVSVKNMINSISSIASYRTLTLCATSYPSDLRTYIKTGNSEVLIPREDWNVFIDILSKPGEYHRLPAFGDYNISNPEFLDFKPWYDISGKIRYTTKSHIYVIKGKSTKSNGFGQMRDLCRVLVNKPFYVMDHCWGSRYIHECSINPSPKGNGNSETWVKVGVNHHLTLVSEQISAL